MKVRHVPLLARLRELYAMPRDMKRFQAYLETIKGGSKDDVDLVPLIGANPMAKPHVAARIDALLALDAERVAADAAAEAERRLAAADGDVKVGLTVVDDVAGGWTDRHLTEYGTIAAKASRDRGWAVPLLWASDEPSAQGVRAAVFASIYRVAHGRRFGRADTLRQLLAQEGRARHFAGESLPVDSGARRWIEPHLDAKDAATHVAALYGDDVARKCGHAPLGLARDAGLAMAIEDARREGDPVRALTAAGPRRG